MEMQSLLERMQQAGLAICSKGEQLHVWPPSHLDDTIRTAIQQHKVSLLAFVDAYEERAAIMEYDGDLSRTEAEAAAYEDVLSNWQYKTHITEETIS